LSEQKKDEKESFFNKASAGDGKIRNKLSDEGRKMLKISSAHEFLPQPDLCDDPTTRFVS